MTDENDISLRDQFAMAALTGLLAQGLIACDETSRESYEMADLMMKARTR